MSNKNLVVMLHAVVVF